MLYIAYLAMTLGQAFGILRFTNRKITVSRILIPFYYWIAPTEEKSKKQRVKKIEYHHANSNSNFQQS